MKKNIIWLAGVLVVFLFGTGPVFAQSVPTIGMAVNTQETVPGGEVTFNVTYRNNDDNSLENGVVKLNLSLPDGLTVKSYSTPPVNSNNGQLVWNLPTELVSGGEGLLTLTVLLDTDYSGESVTATATIDGKIDGQGVSVVSNSVAVGVAEEEDDGTGDDEQKDEDDDNEDENKDEKESDDEKDEIDSTPVDKASLQAGSVEQDDVAAIVGVLDLPEGNINAWDWRYLVIGAAAFIMIISASIIAFFLGRKSK